MHDEGAFNYWLALYVLNSILYLVDFLLTSNENTELHCCAPHTGTKTNCKNMTAVADASPLNQKKTDYECCEQRCSRL